MLRIANWNLERVAPNQNRVTSIRSSMSNVAADIWILTETHQQISPGEEFSSVTSEDPDRESKPGERWVAIWSRFPLESLSLFVSDNQRCTAAKISHPDFGEIVVYAMVLPWGGSLWRGIPSRGGAAFAAALAAYRCDWEQLQKAFPDAIHIVAGDFNQSLVSRHYYGSNRNREVLEKAIDACNMMTVTAGENDPVARDSSPNACIDHTCISKQSGLDISTTQRWPDLPKPEKRLSDHFGVVVELATITGR